jgi:hypothetical protein
MAQVKSLTVTGPSQFLNHVFMDELSLHSLFAPETSGGSSLGLGTSGQVLKTNGSTIYWGADNNSGGTVTSVRV